MITGVKMFMKTGLLWKNLTLDYCYRWNNYVSLSALCVPKPVTPIWFQRLNLQSWKWVYETCEPYILYHNATATVGQGHLIIEDSWSHSDTQQSVGLLWTSDHPDAEISTWQHTTITTDKYPFPQRDSNPQSQQASGRRVTPPDHTATGTGRE